MSAPLSVCYMTCRENPMIHWFFDSLNNQTGGNYDGLNVMVVDFHADQPGRREEFAKLAHCPIKHVPPKPSVWNGPHRLTRVNYFAAAEARNTALCLAPDGFIAYVDDCSVLMPGWLSAAKEATGFFGVTCGRYRKVYKMQVEKGILTFCNEVPMGMDNRENVYLKDEPTPCHANHLYGCSLVAPVEIFLMIGGWPEVCSGMGYEDSVTGMVIANNGWPLRYDRRMFTVESEEHHIIGTQMKREDPGVSPNDKSHAMLRMYSKAKHFPNYWDPDGIRGLRQRVLNGEPFPIMNHPLHEWFLGTPLAEL